MSSIPFVQFDGKMSARRRQEAIAKFSVPIEKSSGNVGNSSRRSSRNSGRSRRSLAEEGANGDSDDDYTPGDGDEDADDAMDSFDTPGDNPRVMLISLKAVCFCFYTFSFSWVLTPSTREHLV